MHHRILTQNDDEDHWSGDRPHFSHLYSLRMIPLYPLPLEAREILDELDQSKHSKLGTRVMENVLIEDRDDRLSIFQNDLGARFDHAAHS